MEAEINLNEGIIADLHIHSRFSRACSKNITFENLVKWARIKGLDILGTGDFTHPIWLSEIKELEDRGKGLYYHNGFPFIITGEISLIYTHEKGRRIHLVLLVPSIEVAEKINSYLDTKGRRDYDGRPIFKISCEEFTSEMMKISSDIEIIPAHIWTPWFSLFGSKSGYDSMKKAFGKEFENIHAIETGMSSDPEMNWKIEELENKSIVSFSDAHSFWPYRLGREATIFSKTSSYTELIKQIRENDFLGTIEVDPNYGKYHWDGHRNCNFSCSPQKSKELNNICPKCGRELVIGVENRVEELASDVSNHKIKKKYFTLLPLHELIALIVGNGMNSKGVWDIYNNLIKEFENEFNILLNVSLDELTKVTDGKLARLIIKNRLGKINVKPGYDGEYGVAQIGEKQGTLF